MILGTSFSHPYVRDHFQLSVEKAFAELLNLKLSLVRLSCYWNEVETESGKYDFGEITELLKMAQKVEQKIILTVGMKAIRWPEFYVPSWTNYEQVVENPERLLLFIKKTIEMVSKYTCVCYLQIENEPFDKSGPQKLIIPLEILEQEINIARQLSQLPIILTAWGNKSLKDNRLKELSKLADIIGLDLYYQIPDGKGGYWGPENSNDEIKRIINKSNKPIWITELQTNPWKNLLGLSPEEIMATNFFQAKQLSVEAILFWGYEYRYSQSQLKPQLLLDYQPDFS